MVAMAQSPNDAAVRAVTLEGEAATTALGRRLAALARPGDVIALTGDLGAGKTVLARGFVHGLGLTDEDVPSPTFTLVQPYDTPEFTLYHFDLYRLKDPDEAFELGIEDAFSEGVSLIEWPDRLGPYLPRNRLDVTLVMGPGETRRALLSGDAWDDRLREANLHQKGLNV